MKLFKYFCLLVSVVLCTAAAIAQTCAAPGKDGPATPSGIVNTYYQGNGDLLPNATTLTLGAASGVAGTLSSGDKLIIMQMQGADINTSDDERYGDGTGTATNQPLTTLSQANGYTALNLAGGFEYVQVSAAVGANITFTPPLVNAYQQNLATQPRRTYQVIRVPQYSSMTVSGAAPLTALAWTGLVGGVLAVDVAGRTTFSGTGPHMDASRRGFRGGAQGVGSNSQCCARNIVAYRSTDFSLGGSKSVIQRQEHLTAALVLAMRWGDLLTTRPRRAMPTETLCAARPPTRAAAVTRTMHRAAAAAMAARVAMAAKPITATACAMWVAMAVHAHPRTASCW